MSSTDMRIHVFIALSFSQLENDTGKVAEASARALVAKGHFEKLRMPKEAEVPAA